MKSRQRSDYKNEFQKSLEIRVHHKESLVVEKRKTVKESTKNLAVRNINFYVGKLI